MAIVRQHVFVHGRVQGVCFRHFTRQEARRLSLAGWVRNRDDGTVEAEFEGAEEAVSLMLAWLRRGSPQSSVSQVQTVRRSTLGLETDFVIR